MKKLIHTTLSLLVTSLVLSQTITVKVDQVSTFAHKGNMDPYYTIINKEWDTTVDVNTKYVLDLSKKVSRFYKDEILVSELPFKEMTKKGDTYCIALLDYDLNNPNDWFQTNIIVNPKTNNFLFYWYDDVWDLTKVESPQNVKMLVKP
jgi:hypothetical protein